MLIGWAAWHALYGHRHRVRVGMQTGMAGLAAWSFLMATAHGAGLMLIPLLAADGRHGRRHATAQHHVVPAARSALALAAVAVHSGRHAGDHARRWRSLVYGWLGVAVLRRGWINLDLVWTAALVATGLLAAALSRSRRSGGLPRGRIRRTAGRLPARHRSASLRCGVIQRNRSARPHAVVAVRRSVRGAHHGET